MSLLLMLLIACPAPLETDGDTDDTLIVDTDPLPVDQDCTSIDTGEPYPLVDTDTEIVGMTDVTLDNYPRVDGSTATEPLAWVIACEQFGLPYEWRQDVTAGTYGILPVSQTTEQQAIADALESVIAHTGTHSAYERLIRGEVDLLLESRAPSDDELALADAEGVALVLDPVARDALLFLVNAQNPIDELTIEQLQAIYLAELTTWDQAGGLDQPIAPYHRNPNSGSYELMADVVMDGQSMPEWPDEWTVAAMGVLVDTISTDENGLGYSVFFYVVNMYEIPMVERLATECVQPTRGTIASGAFPFTTTTYIVTRADLDPTAPAATMRDWLLTDEGRLVVARSGYVPYED